MRAKFINEAFVPESDPIKDMNIGIKPLIDQLADLCDSNLYQFDELFRETEHPFVVEISGTVDHQMSGYDGRFNEIEINGTVTLDPATGRVTIDAATDLVSGSLSTEDEDGEEYEDAADGERDYDNADHEDGSWQQEFNSVKEFVEALEEAAA